MLKHNLRILTTNNCCGHCCRGSIFRSPVALAVETEDIRERVGWVDGRRGVALVGKVERRTLMVGLADQRCASVPVDPPY